MSSKFKILILDLDDPYLEKLKQERLQNCSLITSSNLAEEEILPLIEDVDVIVGFRLSRKIIRSARKLKMIQSIRSGVNEIDIDTATERGVIVCSTTGLNAIPAAEHTLSMILVLAKNITKYDRQLRSEGWPRKPYDACLLHRKTLGIVGLGSVGTEVAKRGKAFGMRVVAIKRHPSEELKQKLGIDFLGGKDDLHRLLRESDFVVVSVPLTPETRKMIGETELQRMKQSAFLVNISRGGVIDEGALINVLKQGSIRGAGLDVFDPEPIQQDNPLLMLKNVVLTPHIGGCSWTEEIINARVKFVVHNISRMIKGQKPEKIVDPVLKYVTERS